MSKTIKNQFTVTGNPFISDKPLSGSFENVVFCKNGVIKIKKNLHKSKL